MLKKLYLGIAGMLLANVAAAADIYSMPHEQYVAHRTKARNAADALTQAEKEKNRENAICILTKNEDVLWDYKGCYYSDSVYRSIAHFGLPDIMTSYLARLTNTLNSKYPLYDAAGHGYLETIKAILPHIRTGDGYVPFAIQKAAENGQDHVINYFFQHVSPEELLAVSDINTLQDSDAAIRFAAISGHFTTVQLLIENKDKLKFAKEPNTSYFQRNFTFEEVIDRAINQIAQNYCKLSPAEKVAMVDLLKNPNQNLDALYARHNITPRPRTAALPELRTAAPVSVVNQSTDPELSQNQTNKLFMDLAKSGDVDGVTGMLLNPKKPNKSGFISAFAAAARVGNTDVLRILKTYDNENAKLLNDKRKMRDYYLAAKDASNAAAAYLFQYTDLAVN